MLTPLTVAHIPAFTAACAYEHVFGSRILTALRAYGLDDPKVRFFLAAEDGVPSAALHLADSVLTVSANDKVSPAPIADLVRQHGVTEVDCSWDLCTALQTSLGGTIESSYYMEYRGPGEHGDFPDVSIGDLRTVFDVLQRSHEYYREHLVFAPWAADWEHRLSRGLSELYQIEMDGQVVGTGSIVSEDDECGALAALAVVPEYRHKGVGSRLTRFLIQRVLEKGKTPRLISGYDEVAELYRKLGFVTLGRWGELYL